MLRDPWNYATTAAGRGISFILFQTAENPALLRFAMQASMTWPYRLGHNPPPMNAAKQLSASDDVMRMIARMPKEIYWTMSQPETLSLAVIAFNRAGDFAMSDSRDGAIGVPPEDAGAVASYIRSGRTSIFEPKLRRS